jgi:uncharacterized protein YecA (UPF0149 family)
MEFGVPGECVQYLDPVLDELGPIGQDEGTDAALAFLEQAVRDGRIPQVAVDHVRAWNDAKADPSVPYVLAYARYAEAHIDDWRRDGVQPPDFDRWGGSFEPARRLPVQGRNEWCACGSGQKYKHCHGR